MGNQLFSYDATCRNAEELQSETVYIRIFRKRVRYKDEEVTEDLPLVQVSEYNKTKMVAERVLLSYRNDFQVQIVRPATVCGLSPK